MVSGSISIVLSTKSLVTQLSSIPLNTIFPLEVSPSDYELTASWDIPANYVVTCLDAVPEGVDRMYEHRTLDCLGTDSINFSTANLLGFSIKAIVVKSYDPLMGYVTLYASADRKGDRVKYFVSHFKMDTTYFMGRMIPDGIARRWYMNTRVNFIDWSTLGNMRIDFDRYTCWNPTATNNTTVIFPRVFIDTLTCSYRVCQVTFYSEPTYQGKTEVIDIFSYVVNINPGNYNYFRLDFKGFSNDGTCPSSVKYYIVPGYLLTCLGYFIGFNTPPIYTEGEMDFNRKYPSIDFFGDGKYDFHSDGLMEGMITKVMMQQYDTGFGYVLIYQEERYGSFTTRLCPSMYDSGRTITIHGDENGKKPWRQDQRISSIKYVLAPNVYMKFSTAVSTVKGSGIGAFSLTDWGCKNYPNLSTITGMNQSISFFQWSWVPVKKDAITAVSVAIPTAGSLSSIELYSFTNNTSNDATHTFTLPLDGHNLPTFTCSILQEYDMYGWAVTAAPVYTYTGGTTGANVYTGSISLNGATFEQPVTLIDSSRGIRASHIVRPTLPAGFEGAKTVVVKAGATINVLADCYELPVTTFSTTASRWYESEVPNSVVDSTNNNLWRRTGETVSGSVSGKIIQNIYINEG